ncbi:hypothetical protein [Ramlibacter sp. AN1133]|uniref:hypothetical protein n=1 Tax=Ramlibacter sp. AN1133 TaxID=3133429 RepID=UPI0030BAFB14
MSRSASSRLGWALVAAACLAWVPAAAGERADFGQQAVSAEARHVADWVIGSNDHAGRPFVVVDKVHPRVFVFDGQGVLQGTAPALVGLARGDETAPGVGQRPMAGIRPEERTTPAGRFIASLERSLKGEEILWVDYDAGVALHPVSVAVAKERRLQRLASLAPADHRITYGCINVPAQFFAEVVAPLFRGGMGVVYVLPETRSAREIFGTHEPVRR